MQLYDIFIQAIELPLPDRSSFIERACNGDTEKISEVSALLDNDDGHNTPSNESDKAHTWSKFLLQQTQRIALPSSDDMGSSVGAFNLIRKLGCGGMGSVYLGERNDGSFEQNVAVKIINPALEYVVGKDNLIREANFMAKLNHANIGKVYDAGESALGSPYIIMEFIEGATISESWSNPNLTLADKLSLFQQLCHAIQHAHQRQIIHADIKPSNILVSSDGQVKVLDFGISRMFGLDNKQTQLSYQNYVKALTAKYASPEVKCGELPSVASDIFSLGKVLADLLSFTQKNTIDAELFAIVEKATANQYTQRYNSVAELQSDVERFLNHDVVTAFTATRWYKIRKFITKKYPVASACAALVILITTGLTGYLSHQSRQVDAAQHASELSVKKLSQLLEMANLKKTNGKELYAKDLLNQANALIAEEKALGSDALAQIKYSLANSYESLGELAKARSLLLDVINNISQLEDKSLAFAAGEQYITQLLYSNEFDKIQQDTQILIDELSFAEIDGLPDTLTQAKFYHQYLNGVKYHLYQSRPSELGERHVQLLRNMKQYYWHDLDPDAKGSIAGALAGALLNQLHNGIEFSFEQIEQTLFERNSRPNIEEAIVAVNDAIYWYQQQNNQVAIIQKQMILGRALVELDRFAEGRTHMESALSSLQKIVGEQHPNNIQFYRIMTGFYAYDAPLESLNFATKGVLLAESNPQIPVIQYLHALDAKLYALNNIGSFLQYEEVADKLFTVYLNLSATERNLDALHIASKILDHYSYLFGKAPAKIAELQKQLTLDYQQMLIPQSHPPEHIARLVDKAFIVYIEHLAQGASFSAARTSYLQQVVARENNNAREGFINKRQKLELELLTLKSKPANSRNNTKLDLPDFPWSSKELRQSSYRIDILLMKASIYQNNGQTELAESLRQIAEQLIKDKQLPTTNSWLTRLKAAEQ